MKKKKVWTPGHKETVRDETIVVKEPTRETEFEVQAYIWNELRSLGINARGEVKSKFCGRAMVRFDVAVFDDKGVLSGIIECKREGKTGDNWTETRQGTRYAQFGVPIRLVSGMSQAQSLVKDAANGSLWIQS